MGNGGRDTGGEKQKEQENLNQKSEKKIVRLADRKCQHCDGEQMERGSCTHRHTKTGREGREREASRKRQVGLR